MVEPLVSTRGFVFSGMLKLLNDATGQYELTIEYQGREYTYLTRRITTHIGEEEWWIWARNKMIRVIYNTARKELREDLQPGQPKSIPDDFIAVLQEVFASRK